MKIFVLTILAILLVAQLAFCEMETFKISATIPCIIGVNYFPTAADIAPQMDGQKLVKNMTREIVFRKGQKIILETQVIK